MSASTSDSRVSRTGLLAAAGAVVLLLLFLYHIIQVLALLIIAILFAVYLSGVTAYLQRKMRVERWAALLLSLLITGVGITMLGWLILPPVLQQVRDLATVIPSTVAGWTTFLLDLGERYPIVRGILPNTEAIERQIVDVQENLAYHVRQLIPYLFSGVEVAIHIISVIVMSIYLALRPNLYLDGFVRLVPVRRRPLARSILGEVGTTLRAWIGAQMVAMVILAVLTWVGLVILNVPFALAFGVFTGVAVVVPFFGTLVSTVLPALFVLGLEDPVRAVLVLLLGIGVHLVEANLVHPLIMERQIRLPPVLSILSVLVMAELFGPVGLLLAVPILAVLMVIVRRVYVEEVLEKKRRKKPKKRAVRGGAEAAEEEEDGAVLQVT